MNSYLNKPLCEGALAILAAAKELFSEKGYAGTSLSEIAARADVSKANIFHHFVSKEELYLAVVHSACKESQQIVDQITDRSIPFPDRFNFFVKSHLQHLLAQEQITRLILRELIEDGPINGKKLAEQVFGEKFSIVTGLMQEGQEKGYLRKEIDPRMFAMMLIGSNVFFFEIRAVLKHLPQVNFADDPDSYSEMLMDMLMRGAGKDSDQPQSDGEKKPKRSRKKG